MVSKTVESVLGGVWNGIISCIEGTSVDPWDWCVRFKTMSLFAAVPHAQKAKKY